MSEIAVQITAKDAVTGEVGTKDVPLHDYFLLTTGDCELAHIQQYGNGTVVLTIKGHGGSR